MSISIGSYSFSGPYTGIDQIANKSGVYSVLTRASGTDSYTIVDIGESATVFERLASHDRAHDWERCTKAAGLSYAAYYCDESTRKRVEQELRRKYSPPCGER